MASKPESVPSNLYDNLSLESLEKAKRELNEVPEETQSCIERLRKDAIDSQNFKGGEAIPLHRVEEDAFLLRFLRNKKFRHDDSLKKYLTFCEFRVSNQDLFEDLDVSKVRHIYDTQTFCVLEPRLKNGCKALLFFLNKVDLTTINFDHMIGAGYLLMDKLLEDPENQVNGLMVIRDWTGVRFADTLRLQLFMRNEMSKFVRLYQDAMPVRFKASWNFKTPWYIVALFKLIKPFLSEKIASRVLFLDEDLEPLYELIDREELPQELGGPKPPMDATHALNLLGIPGTCI